MQNSERQEPNRSAMPDTKWKLLATPFVVGTLAFALTLFLPDRYTASILVAPVEDDAAGRLGGASALVSQFGGLAGLAGVTLGSNTKSSEAIATLKSALIVETLVREQNLLPIIYADDWDTTEKKWKKSDVKDQHTIWEAGRDFRRKIRTIKEDKKTGLVTIEVTWTDPVTSKVWVDALVSMTNRHLREKTIERSNRNLAYLNDQLGKTNIVELRQSIFTLIESETKQAMLANANDEYAFRVVDPSQVPEKKSSPKRLLIAAIAAIAGFILHLSFLIIRNRDLQDE